MTYCTGFSPCTTDPESGLDNEEYCCDGACSNNNYFKTRSRPKIISAVASAISGSLFLIVAIFSFICHRRIYIIGIYIFDISEELLYD